MEENKKSQSRFVKTEETDTKTKSRFSNEKKPSKAKRNYSGTAYGSEKDNNFLLLVIFVVAILPLIARGVRYNPNLSQFDWYSVTNSWLDVFLYWKQAIFVIITAIMAICFAGTFFQGKRKMPIEPVLIPLFIYGILGLLSTFLSKYSSYGWTGIYEQFESVFCLMGYVFLVYYVYLYISNEKNIHTLINAIAFGALVIGLIGTFQGLKYDLFYSKFGKNLLASGDLDASNIGFGFALGRAYATLYNPNYLGVYSTLLVPFFAALFFMLPAKKEVKDRESSFYGWQMSLENMEKTGQKGITYYLKKTLFIILINPQKIIYALVVATLLVSMFAAQFKAGIVSLAIVGLVVLILFARVLWKKWYLTVPIVVMAVGMFFVIDNVNDHNYLNSIKAAFKVEKSAPVALESIDTKKDNIEIVYNGTKYYLTFDAPTDEAGNFVYSNPVLTDEAGTNYPVNLSEDGSQWKIDHEALQTITFGITSTMLLDGKESKDFVCSAIEGCGETRDHVHVYGFNAYIDDKMNGQPKAWTFLKREDGYKFVNNYGRESRIETAETALFDGYEELASKRGFIWARTIPLLKKYFVLGSGADTFVMTFPQRDYVKAYNYGYENQLLTKPHCWYLQVGVQTGALSLIAILVFYGMYFIQSLMLYTKSNFESYASKVGVAVMVGSIGYMISAITNDSSITVAPVFWVVMGIGVTVNAIVKRENAMKKN